MIVTHTVAPDLQTVDLNSNPLVVRSHQLNGLIQMLQIVKLLLFEHSLDASLSDMLECWIGKRRTLTVDRSIGLSTTK